MSLVYSFLLFSLNAQSRTKIRVGPSICLVFLCGPKILHTKHSSSPHLQGSPLIVLLYFFSNSDRILPFRDDPGMYGSLFTGCLMTGKSTPPISIVSVEPPMCSPVSPFTS